MSIMRRMPAASCLAVRLGVYSVVNKFKPLETVSKNGTLFTNMTSIARMKDSRPQSLTTLEKG
jgi:hypothetical protein